MNHQQQPQLPYQPPFVIPTDVTPQFKQHEAAITGFAMMEVLSTQNATPLRGIYAQQVMANNWQNPEMVTLVNAVGQFAEFLLYQRRAHDVPSALQISAQQCMAMLVAVFFQKHQQQLQQHIQTNEQVQQINQLLTNFQQLDREITAFYNQVMPGSAAPMMMQPVGYGAVASRPGPMMGNIGQPMYGSQMNNSNFLYGQQPRLSNPLQSSRPINATGSRDPFAPLPAAGGNTLGNPIIAAPAPRVINPEVARLHGVSTPAPVQEEPKPMPTEKDIRPLRVGGVRVVDHDRPLPTLPAPTPKVSAPPAQEWFTYSELAWPKVRDLTRPWDAVLQENGVELRYYRTSGWEPTFDTANPFPIAYDPTQHLKMYAKDPAGKITEKLIPWKEDTMRYLDHELDVEVSGRQIKADTRDEHVPIDMSVIQRLRVMPDAPLAAISEADKLKHEIEPEEINGDIQPVTLGSAIVVSDLSLASTKLQLLMKKNQVQPDQALEYYVDVVEGSVASAEEASKISALVKAKDLDALVDCIGELEDPTLLDMIDGRMTAAINRVLPHNFGLTNWRMDSFSEDYPELKKSLVSHYGDAFLKQFQGRMKDVVRSALTVSAREDVIEYVRNKLGVSQEDLDAASQLGEPMAVVAFVERVSVTRVAWELPEMHLALDAWPQTSQVQESALPNLRKALQAILARTPDDPIAYSHRYLALYDGTVLEVFEGYLSKDSVLISFADPDLGEF